MNAGVRKEVAITCWEILSLALCVVCFTAWNIVNTRAVYAEVPVFFLSLSLCSWVSGRLLSAALPHVFSRVADFNSCFLLGYLLINTLVLLIQLVLPVNCRTVFVMVLLGFVMILISIVRTSQFKIVGLGEGKGHGVAFLALTIIIVASSLWSQDSISPVARNDGTTLFRPWLDSFYHAREISAAASSHGLRNVGNMMASGEPARAYHYASYLIPAGLCAFTRTSAFQSFCSFLLPCGLLLTGLAAYTFTKFFWGAWAGVAACVALFLVPDPSWMLFENHWYSYQWLLQISPSLMYGIALMAVAWMFMLQGCKDGHISSVAASYVLALLCVSYKAQLFIANAFVIWVYPALFYGTVSRQVRCALSILMAGIYLGVVSYSHRFNSIPFISLDGSAFSSYSAYVLSMSENGWLQSIYTKGVATGVSSLDAVIAFCRSGVMIFVSTFGVFGVLYCVALPIVRKKTDVQVLAFPLIIMVNYMVMSLGLSYEKHGVGTPEELIHRPFVWAYYVVCIWVGGAICHSLEDRLRQASGVQKYVVGALSLFLFLVPYELGADIQRGPLRKSWCVNNRVPNGLVDCCDFIRRHSPKGVVIQDSKNDVYGVVSALSERQCYVVRFFTQRGIPAGQCARLEAVKKVQRMADKNEISGFFAERQIRMYLLHPDDAVSWPDELRARCVYQSGGYKVYSF